jgi:protein O-mannosyl-transferase
MSSNEQRKTQSLDLISKPVVLCLALALVTVAVFFPARNFEFLNYDDPDYFTANLHVQAGLSAKNVVWAFTTRAAANWHPLTWLSLMLDADLFGKNPAGPHLVNLLFHTVNTVLLFLLLRRLTSATWRSAFVAGLFALHPLHVESVAWIAERKDVLSAFFGLLALLCYANYALFKVQSSKFKVESPTEPGFPSSVLWYLTSVLWFTLGLMSKPMLVTLPFVMLLLDFWPLNRFDVQGSRFKAGDLGKLMVEKIPFFALSIAASVITFWVQKSGGAIKDQVPFPGRLGNAFVSYLRYLGKTVWPDPLATPYPHPGHWNGSLVVASVVLVLGVSVAVVLFSRRFPFLFAGWFWFVGMLVPVIGLVQVGDASMADRYMYLPAIGLFIAATWAAGEMLKTSSPKLIAATAMIILLLCGIKTRAQLPFWQNSGTLFRHTLAVTAGNNIADNNLGTWLSANGRPEEAMACFNESLRIKPNNADALFNLGNVYARMGNWDDAIAYYGRALEAGPAQADILGNLGVALAAGKRFPEAIESYERALKLDPGSAELHNNLATVLFQQGRFDAAAEHFQAAAGLAPGNPQFLINLGDALARLGRTNDAVNYFQRALQLQPDNERAKRKLESLQK